MSQPERKLPSATDIGETLHQGLREAGLLLYAAIAVFISISLITFERTDEGWSHSGQGGPIANAAGEIGAWVADFTLTAVGLMAYLLPILLAGYGYSLFRRGNHASAPINTLAAAIRWAGFIVAIASGAALAGLFLHRVPMLLPEGTGGILGQEISASLIKAFGFTGTAILLPAIFLGGITLYTELSWLVVLDKLGRYALLIINGFFSVFHALGDKTSDAPAETAAVGKSSSVKPKSKAGKVEPVMKTAAFLDEREDAARPRIQPVKAFKTSDFSEIQFGELPPLDLLNQKVAKIKGYSEEALEEMSRLVESILDDFGVEVTVVDVHPGPVITRFEIQPAPGVKVSRISGLAKDMARAMSVTSVRVVEVIPGKSVIGLEIPNEEREVVLLYSVLSSRLYQEAHSPLTMVLGKDIGGQPVVANLAKMPHLLVAGTTGSGKSVAVNVMILSMLFKAPPDEVRMIMIDPKMLELSIYEGIPHLLTPVVTDMKEAANALRWSVAEMERRYKLMSMLGVRNLAGYNQKVKDAVELGMPIFDPMWNPSMALAGDGPDALGQLPHIVIIIDELADMMMIVGKKVEELIARLAQKARAAGIHLILATQRPSVDVLTGLIKANIPTRLSFQVSSRIDSRTIIDQGGAEALLGNGDMLFLPPGTGIPMRAHGAFVSDQEVHNVVEFLKSTGRANYIDEITRFSEDGGEFSVFKGSTESGEESDALYDEAVRFVTESRKASISSVQRRFKVGYNRAARMVEDMENAGIVSTPDTNGSREVLAPPPPEL